MYCNYFNNKLVSSHHPITNYFPITALGILVYFLYIRSKWWYLPRVRDTWSHMPRSWPKHTEPPSLAIPNSVILKKRLIVFSRTNVFCFFLSHRTKYFHNTLNSSYSRTNSNMTAMLTKVSHSSKKTSCTLIITINVCTLCHTISLPF